MSQTVARWIVRRMTLRSVGTFSAVSALALALLAGAITASSQREVAPTAVTLVKASSYGLWPRRIVPRTRAAADTARVRLGVEFTTAKAGTIRAIQFYRAKANAGPHTGELWTAGGRLLASVDFRSTTRRGWHTARLRTPVAVSPGETYVASYVAPRGRYAADYGALSPAKPRVKRALTATRGVFTYGGGVPNKSYRDTNYYVDVVFSPGTTAPTPTPTPTPTGACTDEAALYVWDQQPGDWGPSHGLGDYYADMNLWNAVPGQKQHMAVCSKSSWYVTSVVPTDVDQGSVKAYPNVHIDYDWTTPPNPRVDSLASITGTYAGHATNVGTYNVAWDIWLNGVGQGANEVMIWTQNRGQRPAGDVVDTATVAGVAWDVWATSDNKYIAFVPPNGASRKSGTLDLKAFFTYLMEAGRLPSSSTLGQIDYGIEICATDGQTLRFDATDFSVSTTPK